ncbi:MAG: hypothetical protein JXR83_14565 [Deltaproteobacteria bacterium]|nr:hypothetical protein [Deltaproteobacteria bacterium]
MSDRALQPELLLGVVDIPADHWIARLPNAGPLVGAALLVGAAFLDLQDRSSFYFAYFSAIVFFLSLALGALGFVLLHFSARSSWQVAIRRLAEATMGIMPSLLLLFFVAGFGYRYLYPWIYPSLWRTEPSIAGRFPYFKEQLVLLRGAVYFAAWWSATWFFRSQSAEQDLTGNPEVTRRLQRWAPLGLLLVALTTSGAAFDWLMPLDPRWHSPLFGFYFIAGCGLAGVSWIVLLALGLQRLGFARLAIGAGHRQRLGALLIAALALWWLVVGSQLAATRFTGLTDESGWLLTRWNGVWHPWSVLLLAGHALALVSLLPVRIRRRSGAMAIIAGWLLALRVVDCALLVLPARGTPEPRLLVAVCAWLGVAGLAMGLLSHLLVRESLVAERDPQLAESITFDRV